MSKKILKRSLALGALMAFVITGSAMAAEGDYASWSTENTYNQAESAVGDLSYFKDTQWPGQYYSKPAYPNGDDTSLIQITVVHADEFNSWEDFKGKLFGVEEKYYPASEKLEKDVILDSSVGFVGYNDSSSNSSYNNTDLNGHKLTINNNGSGYALESSGYYQGFNSVVYHENYGHPSNQGPTCQYKHIYSGLENLQLDLPGFNIYDSKGGGDLEINSSNVAVYGYGKIDVDDLKLVSDGNTIVASLEGATGTNHKMEIYANSMEVNAGTKTNAIQVYNTLDIIADKLEIKAKDTEYARAIRVANSTANGKSLGTAIANIDVEELTISGATESSKVSDNGALTLSANSGNVVNDFEAASTGTINVSFGSGVNWEGAFTTEGTGNVTLNGATWKITGDSNISTLAGNDGKIVLGLREKAEPQVATFALRNVANEEAEKEFFTLQIGDASDSGAEVTGEGLTEKVESGELTAEEALEKLSESVTVEEGSATLTIEEGDTVGATSATISADGMSTVKQAVNTKAAKVSKAATNLKAHYRAHMNDMNKRMGELRMANGEAGVWTRMVRGESEYQGAKMQYNQYQLGYDEKLSVDKRWTVGAAVTFAEGDGSYGQGSTDDKSTAFAIYGTKLNNDGTFVDLIARYAHLESDMEDSVYGNGDYSTNGYSVSAEFGKRIQQGNGLWVEPQVELTYGTIDSANFKLGTDYNAHFDSMDSFIARVGFSIGKDIKEGNVYARASYLYDFDGETTSLVTTTAGAGTPTPEDFGGGWWEVGVGANINLSKATYIYADIEKTFGGEVDTNWQWNLGVRYSF